MLTISLSSDLGRVIQHLDTARDSLTHGVIGAVRTEAFRLQRHVVQDYLSGQALHRRTGRLSRSIHVGREEVRFQGQRFVGMTAQVGTNVEYAARHEFGFKGTERVRGHNRTITNAFGKKIAPTTITVSAFSRRVSYPARPFLRPAMNDMAQDIQARLAAIVRAAFGGPL